METQTCTHKYVKRGQPAAGDMYAGGGGGWARWARWAMGRCVVVYKCTTVEIPWRDGVLYGELRELRESHDDATLLYYELNPWPLLLGFSFFF